MTGRPYPGAGLRHTITNVFSTPDDHRPRRFNLYVWFLHTFLPVSPLSGAGRPPRYKTGRIKRGLTGALLLGGSSFFADAAALNTPSNDTVNTSADTSENSTADLETFLAALSGRPELSAAAAQVRAAEANLAAAKPPAALDVIASSGALASDAPLGGTRLEVGVTVYPFTYGQLGDTVRLRELELDGVRLDLRAARGRLEARALVGALELELAQETLTLARAAGAAAERALETAQLQRRRELVTAGALRDAEAARQRAQNLVADAEADLTLAETTLTSLVGDVRLGVLPELPTPQGKPQSLRRAELELAAARVAEAGTDRQFYPVAELGYAYEVSPQTRVTASVNSRDLAPRVGYSFNGDGYAGGGSDTALSLRVSASLSPEQFQNAARFGELLGAAQENLRAAQQNALGSEAALRNRRDAAGRERDLGALMFRDAETTLEEVEAREALGVGTPLETQAAAVALAEAGLELRDARREQLTALLDLYELYGLPVSEARPVTAGNAQ